MASRSLSISQQFIGQVRSAVAKRGLTQEQLASELNVSRSSLVKFLSGKNVDRRIFVRFCDALGIDWENVSGTNPRHSKKTTDIDIKVAIDAVRDFITTVRGKVEADIQARCGTMRVLDMEQPIGIGDIYIDVNILEKLSGNQRLGIDELLTEVSTSQFDRFLLGQVRQQRVLGREAVERYDKLMILGKPGAGKTTFMKRLAMLCNWGELQRNRVPVFVTLKEFAEAAGQPGLQDYITRQWRNCGINEPDTLAAVFERGLALILLDGLDEVQETQHDRVLQEIKDLTERFRGCQFVITCRIAAREYVFQQFTEVEIADFNDEQIAGFATKWFATKKDPEKSKNFIQQLENNQPIQELATNPLLLTLLCLVFGEAADFPANRSELYKEGLDVLLKKWDAKRNIERDQVYKRLSLKRKEDLLSQLAFYTFDRGDYFFKQAVVERQIVDYIRNLPGAKEDDEALQLDGADVLKSIEAQHGLLVERARGIYSFSHLTFQEYFTARHIARPTAQLQTALTELTTHMTKRRYREIFLLTVGMLPEADELLKLMEQEVEQLLADEPQLNQFVSWVNQKSKSINVPYKKAAIRALYLDFIRDSVLAHSRNLDHGIDIAYKNAAVRESYLNAALSDARVRSLACALDHNLANALALDLAHDCTLALDRTLALNLDLALDLAFTDSDITLALSDDLPLDFDLALKLTRDLDPELQFKLESLKARIPDMEHRSDWKQWWQNQGKDWTENLRSTVIEHRNIGHDWRFTHRQREILQKYYDANRLLVDCLNSDCYVTKATRQEIEDMLLLPTPEHEVDKIQPPG